MPKLLPLLFVSLFLFFCPGNASEVKGADQSYPLSKSHSIPIPTASILDQDAPSSIEEAAQPQVFYPLSQDFSKHEMFTTPVRKTIEKAGLRKTPLFARQLSLFLSPEDKENLRVISEEYSVPFDELQEFRNQHKHIKRLKSKEVSDPRAFLLTPLARQSGFKRQALKDKGVFLPYKLCFSETSPDVKQETMRQENLKLQKILTQQQRQEIFSVEKTLITLEEETAFWVDYITYVRSRKQGILDGSEKKITRHEIVLKFSEYVAKYYEFLIVGNYTVYFNRNLLNADYVDEETQQSNLVLMQSGLAPIGIDGERMNLHHVNHVDPGVLVAITGTLHRTNSGDLHFAESIYRGRPKYPVNRGTFEKAKNVIYQDVAVYLQQSVDPLMTSDPKQGYESDPETDIFQ